MRRFFTMVLTVWAVMSPALFEVAAQKMPERGLVRRGNRQFGRMNYDRSIELYRQALAADSTSWEARYDLGNALFRAEHPDKAEQMLARAAADTTRTAAERADAFFNLGDVQFSGQNLQGALESFKNALRLNPSDVEAKYNYAYVKKMLEQQQNDDRNGDGQNDQNKDNQNKDDQNQNQNQDQNQDQDQNQNGDDNGENDGSDGSSEPREGDDRGQEGQPQPREGISPEQQAAMLDAIQAQEDKTQEKVKEKQGVIVRGNKNW